MKSPHLTHCLVGVGIAAAVLLAFGVEPGTLAFLAATLACPLMMIVMMRAMAGAAGSRDHGHDGRRVDVEGQPVERRR